MAYEKMSDLFSTVIHHTRNVDILTAQLREHASFTALFWHRADLHRVCAPPSLPLFVC
jgi:hypothetical protein